MASRRHRLQMGIATVAMVLMAVAASDEACQPPLVGPFHSAAQCSGMTRCQSCWVTCSAGNIGEASLLRCLGEDDAMRNESFDMNTTCDMDGNDEVSLVHATRCGFSACCPPSPERPCATDTVDVLFGSSGQCDFMLSGSYSCETDFCPTCGLLAGYCDRACRYGACDHKGDCWRGGRDGSTGPTQCDDGNTKDGDGCSSLGIVEPGFNCTKVGAGRADMCIGCIDEPGWLDEQGYSCQDYAALNVCDSTSLPTDPAIPGGRFVTTPSFHKYQLMYDVDTSTKPVIVNIGVRAGHDIHLFLGRPYDIGFEAVIGGWENSMSVLRAYTGPTNPQEVSRSYGSHANETQMRHFWLYYDNVGNLWIGEGTMEKSVASDVAELLQNVQTAFLGGTGELTQAIQTNWGAGPMDQLHIATGWGASGEWDVRLVTGSEVPTFEQLAASGKSPTQACCACGGGHRGTQCEIEETGVLGTMFRLDASTAAPTSRRLSSGHPLQLKLYLFGQATGDGFRVQISFQCPARPCTVDLIVVPRRAASQIAGIVQGQTSSKLHKVWPAIRSSSCRIKGTPIDSFEVDYRWTASACAMKEGYDYTTVAIYTYGGNTVGTFQLGSLHFSVPTSPVGKPQSIEFVDSDPIPMEVAGVARLEGAVEDEGILQYRIYFGKNATDKVDAPDPRAAIAGHVNTFGTGGLRNDFNNGCLYNDCAWKMEPLWTHRRRTRYKLRHSHTGECFCQSPDKVLRSETCPGTLDSTLLASNPDFYMSQALQYSARCIWRHDSVIINSTVESRLRNSGFNECLCQVPAARLVTSDGEYLPMPAGEAAVQLLMGKWCDTYLFSYRISNKQVSTRGYCEWILRSVSPADDATRFLLVDAKKDYMQATISTTFGSASLAVFDGLPSYRMSGDGGLQPPLPTRLGWTYQASGKTFTTNPFEIGKDHAFAAWVRFRRLPTDPEVIGRRSIFAARIPGGAQESCMLVEQRSPTDDRSPECPLPACNVTVVDQCCSRSNMTTSTTTIFVFPTTTTTVTDSTTLETNWSSNTSVTTTAIMMHPEAIVEDVCACRCPGSESEVNITDGLGERFVLGLEACSSASVWDSGFNFIVPNQGTGWMLLIATGSGTSDGFGETVFYASTPLEPFSVIFEGQFGCMQPGCTATGIIYDVPRDGTRTCYLNVGVYVTDFATSDATVTEIRVEGAYPRIEKVARQACRPDGSNDHGRLFSCVEKYNVDDLVVGAHASRSLKVHVTISKTVDQFPKDGNYLSGVAQVVCKRTKAVDKYAPPSGTIRRVGVAGRTCAGATLEAIGGDARASESGLEVDVSQAWAFDRFFDEMDAVGLFHETRTRYFQDYEAALGGGQLSVTSNLHEAKATGNVRCYTPGCASSLTLTGLPTTHAATCLLTVLVLVTDFSNDDEYVEYIRLDGSDVVVNCQIGLDADTLGTQTQRYACADKLDVSQEVLRNTYLKDGAVEVSMKISAAVDSWVPQYGNYLDANIELHCSGPGSGTAGAFNGDPLTLPEEQRGNFEGIAIHTLPATTHLLTTSANLEGESGYFAETLTDRVNGFKTGPAILGEVSQSRWLAGVESGQAVAVQFEAIDTTGSIYVYAVERMHSFVVTREDIVGTGIDQYDICPQSSRRRGYDATTRNLLATFDSILNNCVFQPTVPYTILVYVDRGALPHGGGTIGRLNVVGPMPQPPYDFGDKPKLKARKVEFTDTDNRTKFINGQITITSAYSEDAITHYEIWFGLGAQIVRDASGQPAASALIGTIAATGASQYVWDMVPYGAKEMIPCPNCASHILVIAKNSAGLSDVNARIVIKDLSMELVQVQGHVAGGLAVPVGNDDAALTRFKALMRLSGGDAFVDIAVVPKGREVYGRALDDQSGLDWNSFVHDGVDDVVCKRTMQSDLQSFWAVFCGGLNDNIVPGVEYGVVFFANIRTECPCAAPCACTGALTTSIQAYTATDPAQSSKLVHSGNYFKIPDMNAPDVTATSFGGTTDRTLTVAMNVQDPGSSYPVLASCMACIAEVKDPRTDPALSRWYTPLSPAFCVRPGDADAHLYWRVRFKASDLTFCGSTLELAELEFFQLAVLNATGEQVTGIPIHNVRNTDPQVNLLFDGQTDAPAGSNYKMSVNEDPWAGLVLSEPGAIIRARLWFVHNVCANAELPAYLDYSDNGVTWTTRFVTKFRADSHAFRHIYAGSGTPPDTDGVYSNTLMNGTFYQTIITGEGLTTATVHGLTPNTTYVATCMLKDSRGNGVLKPNLFQATTTDSFGPSIWFQGFTNASDFSATARVKIKDPGRSYPAFTRCVAREYVPGTPLPSLSSVRGKDNMCKHFHAGAAQDNSGRIPYEFAYEAWLTEETAPVVVEQRAWGGARKEMMSCGLRQQPMLSKGACGTIVGARMQALQFSVVVNGFMDAYIFIGENKRFAVGYEIIIGGANTKSEVRRGYSSDPVNVNLDWAATKASWVGSIFYGPGRWSHLWVVVDPSTGRVAVGRGEIFNHDTIMEYMDPYPIDAIDKIWLGAGYHSGGGDGIYGVNFILCPRIGNVLLHQTATSSSVAFKATPDKAIDGMATLGANSFLPYYKQADSHLVCAQTRRGGQFTPPWIKVDMGKDVRIEYVRIIGAKEHEVEPAQSLMSVYIGNSADRGDTPCFVEKYLYGDNVIRCDIDQWGIPGGRVLSIYGSQTALASLPENMGIRVCEVEAYEYGKDIPFNDYEFSAFQRYQRMPGLPDELHVTVYQDFEMRGLQPNTTYEAFCYGEDHLGNYSLSGAAYVTTTDNVPPLVSISSVKAYDYKIEVNLSLDDPGNSYPAFARCGATVNGTTPQEHERFFQHQFWRMKFTPPPSQDSNCENQIHIRAASLQDALGQRLSGFEFASSGPQGRGLAPTTYKFYELATPLAPDQTAINIVEIDEGDMGELAWSLPWRDAWIGWDMFYVHEFDQKIAAQGGTTFGDLVISFEWNDTTNFYLTADVPGPYIWNREQYSTPHGYMDVRCQDWSVCGVDYLGQTSHLESGTFAVASPGEYKIYVTRGVYGEFDASFQPSEPAFFRLKLCDQVVEIPINVNISWDNNTVVDIITFNFDAQQSGCSRASRIKDLKSWQSSTNPGLPHPPHTPSWWPPPKEKVASNAWDHNFSTCSETLPTQEQAWWRSDLGQTARVEAVWLAGNLSLNPAHSRYVDVYIVDGDATAATQGQLCALKVPIGEWQDSYNPIRAVNCARDAKGAAPVGDHIWVVNHGSEQAPIGLCEVEVFMKPVPVAAKAFVQWGRAPNSTRDFVCGAQHVTVQWSDDNVTWATNFDFPTIAKNEPDDQSHQEIVAAIDGARMQNGTWPWWSRLFQLDFTSTFSEKAVQTIEIPKLRSNTTYDIFCWAIDNNGNDISRDLVLLFRPWGLLLKEVDTQVAMHGDRRLMSLPADDGRLQCTMEVQELIPCEERIITTDKLPPLLRSSVLSKAERTLYDYAGYQAFWDISLIDPSCEHRLSQNAVTCHLRCEVFEPNEVPDFEEWYIESATRCLPPECAEETWSNEAAVTLRFQYLVGGGKFKLLCGASDPWGNTLRLEEEFTMAIITTTRAPTPPPPRPPPPPPPSPPQPLAPTPNPTSSPRRRRTPQAPSIPWVTMGPSAPSIPSPPQGYTGDVAHRRRGNTPMPYRPPTTTPSPTTRAPTAPPVVTAPPAPATLEPRKPEVALPTPPVNALVALRTSSKEQAEVMIRPAAIQALQRTLAKLLQLTSDDVIEMQAAHLVRALGGRRLDADWEVRFALVLRMIGQTHSNDVKTRMTSLHAGSPLATEFAQVYGSEMIQQQMPVDITVASSSLLDAYQMASEVTAARASTQTQAGSSEGSVGQEGQAHNVGESSVDSSDSDLMKWLVPVLVAVALVLFCIPVVVVCALWVCTKSVGSIEKEATTRTARINSRLERDNSKGKKKNAGRDIYRPWMLQNTRPRQSSSADTLTRVPSKISATSLTESRNACTSEDAQPGMCRIAWAPHNTENTLPEECTCTPDSENSANKRQGTPLSEMSTQSGNSSIGSSRAFARSKEETLAKAHPPQRSSAVISAAPQLAISAEDSPMPCSSIPPGQESIGGSSSRSHLASSGGNDALRRCATASVSAPTAENMALRQRAAEVFAAARQAHRRDDDEAVEVESLTSASAVQPIPPEPSSSSSPSRLAALRQAHQLPAPQSPDKGRESTSPKDEHPGRSDSLVPKSTSGNVGNGSRSSPELLS